MGRVQILLDVDVDLTGRDVILVEDIVDTGLTLRYLLGVLRARPSVAGSVRVARQVGPADRPDRHATSGSIAPIDSCSATVSTSPSVTATSPTSSRSTTSTR